MRKHKLITHENCQKPHCEICDGGLSVCAVCGGGEGSLPSECPGQKMTSEQDNAVYAGDLDFKCGEWMTNG